MYNLIIGVRFPPKMYLLLSMIWTILFSEKVNAATQTTVVSEVTSGRCVVPVRVAVIGGGITAAATTRFLRKLEATTHQTRRDDGCAPDPRQSACARSLRIDVFEAGDRLGGRLDFVTVPGGYVEAGGVTIHSSNKYMGEFINIYKADHEKARDEGDVVDARESVSDLMIFEWHNFVFNGESILHGDTIATASLKMLAELVERSWNKLYKVFDGGSSGSTFDSSSFLRTIHATFPTDKAFNSGLEMLEAVGISHWVYRKLCRFVEDLALPSVRHPVEAIVLSTYTQSSSIQSLAGIVALLGALGKELPTNVPHRRVVEHLIGKFADHIYLDCKVQKVLQQVTVTPGKKKTHAYTLEASKCGTLTSHRLREQKYDYVVVATQLSNDLRLFRLEDTGESVELSVPYYDYQEVFVTIVQAVEIKEGATLVGHMSAVVATAEHAPSIGTFFVSSCGVIIQGVSQFVICNLKSGRELSDDDLAALFRGVRLVERRRWKAYPYMYPFADTSTVDSTTYPAAATKFELMPGLFYPNAFEGLFSCMEGQAVAARNVAQLIMNSLESRSGDTRRDSSPVNAFASSQADPHMYSFGDTSKAKFESS